VDNTRVLPRRPWARLAASSDGTRRGLAPALARRAACKGINTGAEAQTLVADATTPELLRPVLMAKALGHIGCRPAGHRRSAPGVRGSPRRRRRGRPPGFGGVHGRRGPSIPRPPEGLCAHWNSWRSTWPLCHFHNHYHRTYGRWWITRGWRCRLRPVFHVANIVMTIRTEVVINPLQPQPKVVNKRSYQQVRTNERTHTGRKNRQANAWKRRQTRSCQSQI
jgi:hypothetical protein